MKIALLAFASAGDILGTGETVLEIPRSTTLAELKAILEERHPAFAPLWTRIAVAVNGDLRSDETTLVDGDEVALLPPVSGGSGTGNEGAAAELPVLTDEPLDPTEVARRVELASCGAVVLFSGTVRDSHQGRRVERITYSAYRTMAADRLRQIARRLESRHPGTRVAIVHRLGEIAVGEASVVIAVASPHREAAYAASREALERLKGEVPIWKREHYADGASIWREEEALAPHGADTRASQEI
ncbi:MAG TPA: molybdenum cofactor biosynthesis protein MoaE [Thermoanaerobaculia bacterium]|nr:molybdenum cofactor biosynthesis protein MoaE [Thermoanaerobaculia bacterium]